MSEGHMIHIAVRRVPSLYNSLLTVQLNLHGLMHLPLSASAFSRITYFIIVLAIAFLLFVANFFILSQAVRTANNREWAHNANALVIGAAYVAVVRVF